VSAVLGPCAVLRGARFGPYEIVSPIGAGATSEVYRAFDSRLERFVALKLLARARPFGQAPRFVQEARAAAAINHPNVLTVHDLGHAAGIPYLVTELLEGDTLRASYGTPLPTRQALDYALQIAHGLAAAHDQGIVHRDLKPENVFVTLDGRVKLLDFGIASAAHSSPAPRAPTDTLRIAGTAGYMSPEQIRGLHVDHRSDVFALGAILYELLSGARAFAERSAVETMTATLNEEPPPIGGLPAGTDRIVRRCLEKRPERRFQSSPDLAFSLAEASERAATSGDTPDVRVSRPRKSPCTSRTSGPRTRATPRPSRGPRRRP
jgi:serine/threonine protein kinase